MTFTDYHQCTCKDNSHTNKLAGAETQGGVLPYSLAGGVLLGLQKFYPLPE